ncbi:hypothetical protein CBL_20224 [Carabus blaptoides fortunei]
MDDIHEQVRTNIQAASSRMKDQYDIKAEKAPIGKPRVTHFNRLAPFAGDNHKDNDGVTVCRIMTQEPTFETFMEDFSVGNKARMYIIELREVEVKRYYGQRNRGKKKEKRKMEELKVMMKVMMDKMEENTKEIKQELREIKTEIDKKEEVWLNEKKMLVERIETLECKAETE